IRALTKPKELKPLNKLKPKINLGLASIILASFFFLALPGSLLAQPAVFNHAYSHFSEREPISDLLSSFAASYNLRAFISPVLTGTISGKFDNIAPSLFLDGLRSAFGVNWYLLGRNIYFFHDSEWGTKTYHPQASSPEAIFNALKGSASVSPQLTPKISGLSLIFEGPKSYIETLETEAAAIDGFRQEPKLIMRVFKLRHAQADDVTINAADRSVTIPGVATILNSMIRGGALAQGSMVRPNQAQVAGLSSLSSSRNDTAQPVREEAQVMAEPRVNAVIISDYEDRMSYYESVIRELDREVHLVEIHAAIVDVNTNFKRELGVNWQGVATPGDVSVGADVSNTSGNFDVLPSPGQALGGGATVSTVYTQGPNYFIARIQALEQAGEARLLGRPSVLTLDNQEATLENTTTYYIQVAGYQTVDLFKVDSGTVLRVTPHIVESYDSSPASIRLNVTVQDSQDSADTAATGNMAIPPVKQTKINTQALIQNGQSLLIGGYYFESRQDNDSGTPGLGKIPILGHLFKTTSDTKSQMERMVLITPRIIRLGEVQQLPSHLDDESFSRSPTQADYEPRVPVTKGGCAGL
ncbi:MAG: type III secretion system outer membrane ring subunit SctC, partial [Deltaproteobacteria bacterium]|nr:type III secretion system outer membrane ring subunit SctC [Deltaproteobacteria bacterium]